MRVWIILAVLVLVVLALYYNKSSYDVPSGCNPTPISVITPCADVYPDYPELGPVTEDKMKKYCCKKT